MFLNQDSNFSLKIRLMEIVNTSNVQISITYNDNIGSYHGDFTIEMNNITPITILEAPLPGIVNIINLIKIYNSDTIPHNIEIIKNETIIYTSSIGAKESLILSETSLNNGLGFTPQPSIGTVTGILKAVGDGNITSAVDGIDYPTIIADGTILNVPSDFETIQDAINYLIGKNLSGNVTIQIADGIYNGLSPIIVNHHQSNLITIQGNITDKSLVILNFLNDGFIWESQGGKISYLTITGSTNSLNNGILSEGLLYLENIAVNTFKNGLLAQTGVLKISDTSVSDCFRGWYSNFGNINGCYKNQNNIINNCTNCLTSINQGSIFCGNNLNAYGETGITCGRCSTVIAGYLSGVNITGTINAAIAHHQSFISLVDSIYSGNLSPIANTDGNYSSYIEV